MIPVVFCVGLALFAGRLGLGCMYPDSIGTSANDRCVKVCSETSMGQTLLYFLILREDCL